MAVRVRLRLRNNGKEITIVALVNGGAESEEPVVVITPQMANELGLNINEMGIIEVELASGTTHNYISNRKLKVELLGETREVISSTYAYVAVDENLTEPLITDATIDELGIQVISFRNGLWRHINDPPGTIRRSATTRFI